MIKLFDYFLTRIVNLWWRILYRIPRSKYNIHPSFRFNGKYIEFYGKGEIIIDRDSYIGSYSTVQASDGCKVQIGHRCKISHNVRIYTSTLEADQDMLKDELMEKHGDVIIGNGVWIGANVFINPNVNIGDNSIIGSNSVVTKDVKQSEIVGGVPSKLIRMKKGS
ncbi:MAG: acyltransferase [Chitinophagales bacterium]|nr:acyltransferase [Chitinophagales bacterium]